MLQAIRDKATGWLAWVIVSLLIIPFALWGIQEYFGGGADVNAAVVNDVEIPRSAFLNQLELEMRGQKTRPEGKQEIAFRKNVLEKIIGEELIVQKAAELGFRVSEAHLASQIQATAAFQKDGVFDEATYRQILQNNNLTVPMYQQMQSRQMLVQQYIGGIADTGFLTNYETDEVLRLQERRLKLAYFVIPAEADAADIVVGEKEIASFYEENKSQYIVPEQIKISYLKLDAEDLEKEIEVSEEDVRALYDEQKDNFRVEDQRKVAHILIELDTEADEDKVNAAIKKAGDIRKQLDAGTSFADLAKKYSDDAGSVNQGGDLGVIEKNTLDKAFEDAVFALKKGEVSEPVRSSAGVHLIKLVDLKPGHEKSFDQVRALLEKQYRSQQAESVFFDRSERLYDLTYENPESLEVAARELGLQIMQSDWFSRVGSKEGIGSEGKVIGAAFSEDVFAGGDSKRSHNSKLLELKQANTQQLNPAVVLRLQDYKPTRQRTIDEVREQVTVALKTKLASEQAYNIGKQMADRLKAGEGIEKLATEQKLELKRGDYIRRNDSKHNSAVLSSAFKMQKPSKDKPVNAGVKLPDGGYAVVSITDYRDGKESDVDERTRKFLAQVMHNIYSTAEVETLITSLRSNASVTINQEMLIKTDEN